MFYIQMLSIGINLCGSIFEANFQCIVWLVTSRNLVSSISSYVRLILNQKKAIFLLIIFISSFPFDTKTIAGHYVALTIQSFMTFIYTTIFSTILSLYIGFCRYIEALLEDFQSIIAKLNVLTLTSKESRSSIEEKEIMVEAIKLHLEMLT